MTAYQDFQTEYNRLFNWRSLWTRLANRKPKGWRSRLQFRADAIERKAQLANDRILSLMHEYDKVKADQSGEAE